jgi:hypothetical protein
MFSRRRRSGVGEECRRRQFEDAVRCAKVDPTSSTSLAESVAPRGGGVTAAKHRHRSRSGCFAEDSFVSPGFCSVSKRRVQMHKLGCLSG